MEIHAAVHQACHDMRSLGGVSGRYVDLRTPTKVIARIKSMVQLSGFRRRLELQ